MEVDSRKRSDYLLLIQARLYGWSGSTADKEGRLDQQIHRLKPLIYCRPLPSRVIF